MNLVKRKTKKLLRDPKLFVTDMYIKKTAQLKKKMPIKYDGYEQYTVVSAVYNVEKYLEDYFSSLTSQTLNFKKHIHLILVDDGSTDNSAAIIKKWQKKYPKNIHYFHKENGGISSARNLGLQHIKTKWVTFIDSDDFVAPDYFKIIDYTIHNNDNIQFAAGNLKFYFEENKLVQDTHSLKYRFKKKLNIVPINNLDNNINLFVTVSFFKTEILHKNKITFDEKIKPNFEDGKFLADYFLHTEQGYAAYVQKAVFFYRKRGDGSSTIDGSWLKKEKFYNPFAFGYIPMLQAYRKKYNVIPKNIQWTVLYEIFWHIKKLMNHDEYLHMLTSEETEAYRSLITETLSYIDSSHIEDFDLINISELHKTGLAGLKDNSIPSDNIRIEGIDRNKRQLTLYRYSTANTETVLLLNGQTIKPDVCKTIIHTFGGKPFVYGTQIQISCGSEKDRLTVVTTDSWQQCWEIREIFSLLSPYRENDQ